MLGESRKNVCFHIFSSPGLLGFFGVTKPYQVLGSPSPKEEKQTKRRKMKRKEKKKEKKGEKKKEKKSNERASPGYISAGALGGHDMLRDIATAQTTV